MNDSAMSLFAEEPAPWDTKPQPKAKFEIRHRNGEVLTIKEGDEVYFVRHELSGFMSFVVLGPAAPELVPREKTWPWSTGQIADDEPWFTCRVGSTSLKGYNRIYQIEQIVAIPGCELAERILALRTTWKKRE